MRLSDEIAAYILNMLECADDGEAELRRNELAEELGCVPSQINYVLTSRFTPEQGYIIESRRGGGGYIRIIRLDVEKNDYLHYLLSEGIGTRITEKNALQIIKRLFEQGDISEKSAYLMKSAITDKAIMIPTNLKDNIRAGILKSMITAIITWNSKKV